MKKNYPKTYNLIREAVSNEIFKVSNLDSCDKKELCAAFMSECDSDNYADSLLDKQVRDLVVHFLEDGFDYAIALQEVLSCKILQENAYIFTTLFEEAESDWQACVSDSLRSSTPLLRLPTQTLGVNHV